jgi:hypothetical protein
MNVNYIKEQDHIGTDYIYANDAGNDCVSLVVGAGNAKYRSIR